MSRPTADSILRWTFALIVLLVLMDRMWMLRTTMHHASDDLAVVWLAAVDYAHGRFHEPFFYGQDYGVMLEALLAAPFVGLGADPVSMVALLLAVFGVAPYLAFAFHHRSRNEHRAALLFAAMPLLLPVEHGLQITALNGLAVLALVPLGLRITKPEGRAFLLALTLSFAVFVNPNTALLAVPLTVHLLLQHRTQWRIWSSFMAGTLPAILCWAWARAFFAHHEADVVNTIFDWRMHFKPYLITEAMKRLDLHFAWTGPLCGDDAWLVLPLLAGGAGLLFHQRNRAAGWAAVASLVLILLSFCFAKVHDGSASIFFSLSRVFMGMPILLAWVFAQLRTSGHIERILLPSLALIAILHAGYRLSTARRTFEEALRAQDGLPVRTWPVSTIRRECALVADLAHETGADQIVLLRSDDPFTAQFLAYGIPVFRPEAPMTWMVGHDRRAFQRVPLLRSKVDKALVVGASEHVLSGSGAIGSVSLVRPARPRCVLIKSNGRPIGEMVDALR